MKKMKYKIENICVFVISRSGVQIPLPAHSKGRYLYLPFFIIPRICHSRECSVPVIPECSCRGSPDYSLFAFCLLFFVLSSHDAQRLSSPNAPVGDPLTILFLFFVFCFLYCHPVMFNACHPVMFNACHPVMFNACHPVMLLHGISCWLFSCRYWCYCRCWF